MADPKPPTIVTLDWNGGLAFTARDGRHEWVLDGRNETGPSPVVALASALAGCLAVDVVHILTRGRFDVRSLGVHLEGHRADTEPRRFVRIALQYTVDTDAPPHRIEQAIALSREKYCSVWHSMRQDIELTTSVVSAEGQSRL
jgi:putative redox protein